MKIFKQLFGIELSIQVDDCLLDYELRFLLPQIFRVEQNGILHYGHWWPPAINDSKYVTYSKRDHPDLSFADFAFLEREVNKAAKLMFDDKLIRNI